MNCRSGQHFDKLVAHSLLLDSGDKFKTTAKIENNVEFQTPSYTKLFEDKYGSTMEMESEFKFTEHKINREKIGNDLKLQWTQMMHEFEQGPKQMKGIAQHHSEQLE